MRGAQQEIGLPEVQASGSSIGSLPEPQSLARGPVTVKPMKVLRVTDLRLLLPLLNIYCALSLYEVL